MRKTSLALFILLGLAALCCFGQGLAHSPAYRAAAVPITTGGSGNISVNVDFAETWQGGTNGNVGVEIDAVTNALSWRSSWRPWTWTGLNSLSGGSQTNLNTANTMRFAFTNDSVPPSPYITWNVTGTNFGGGALGYVLRYNSRTNGVPGMNPSDTWEVIDGNPPYFPSNSVTFCKFMTTVDNSAGDGSSRDIYVSVSTVGSQSWSINLARGTSGTTEYFRIEVGTNGTVNLPILTNRWYLAAVLSTNYVAAGFPSNVAYLYDIASNYAVVGVVGTNAGVIAALTGYSHQRWGQSGHAPSSNVQAKAYDYFGDWAIQITNIVWPPVVSAEGYLDSQGFVHAWEPLPFANQQQAEAGDPEPADKREWLPGETVFIRALK
jgi:hypothetical protein